MAYGNGAVHRLNTYPLVHLGIFHMLFNLVALAPLLERFEKEHGSLLTLLHLLGREYQSSPLWG